VSDSRKALETIAQGGVPIGISPARWAEQWLAAHPEDKFQNVKPGLWRNDLGAELHVIGTASRRSGVTTIAGDIAIAEDRDPLFKTVTTVLVTNHSLQRCGYELIEKGR
jgi:hypothetical protein